MRLNHLESVSSSNTFNERDVADINMEEIHN